MLQTAPAKGLLKNLMGLLTVLVTQPENTSKMEKTTKKQTERRVQSDSFQWFHNGFPHLRGLLFHVPNGGNRDPREVALFRAMGVVAGIPDLVFLYRGKAHFIEFKKPDGTGSLSSDQIKIHEIFGLHNFEVWTIESLHDFKEIISEIMAREHVETEIVITKDDYFYTHSVFQYLYSLDIASVVLVADVCAVENFVKFMDAIGNFIEKGLGLAEGWEILFTPDYQGFYKKELNSTKEIFFQGKNVVQ